MKKIGFIGAGNMGSALAKAAVRSGAEVYIYDKDTEKANAVAKELSAFGVIPSDLPREVARCIAEITQ